MAQRTATEAMEIAPPTIEEVLTTPDGQCVCGEAASKRKMATHKTHCPRWKTYVASIKPAAIARAKEISASQAAKEFGLAQSTVSKWLKRERFSSDAEQQIQDTEAQAEIEASGEGAFLSNPQKQLADLLFALLKWRDWVKPEMSRLQKTIANRTQERDIARKERDSLLKESQDRMRQKLFVPLENAEREMAAQALENRYH